MTSWFRLLAQRCHCGSDRFYLCFTKLSALVVCDNAVICSTNGRSARIGSLITKSRHNSISNFQFPREAGKSSRARCRPTMHLMHRIMKVENHVN